MTYLLINLFSIAIPLGFSFHPRLKFWQSWRAWLPAIVLPAIPFLLWDVYFTRQGVWGFTPEHLLGISLLGLPLEEWLFFITIPYACLFTYHSLKVLLPAPFSPSTAGKIALVLALLFLAFGIFQWQYMYTGTTFFLAGSVILIYLWKSGGRVPEYFFMAYVLVYALPFLIVNGILTGSGLSQPVVWYNNGENLSLRVLTIPVEDFVYGFLLFFLNVGVYEWRLAKQHSRPI